MPREIASKKKKSCSSIEIPSEIAGRRRTHSRSSLSTPSYSVAGAPPRSLGRRRREAGVRASAATAVPTPQIRKEEEMEEGAERVGGHSGQVRQRALYHTGAFLN